MILRLCYRWETMQNPTQDAVLNALRTVMDPDLHRDLVSLNMIHDLEVRADGSVSLRAVLTTPACPMKGKIEADIRAAVGAVPGVNKVDVKMDAQVRKGAVSGSNSIPGVAHIIAVSSGKGGVGKSTVAVNLATALALEGARVGLMDADVYGPNVPTMMGVTDEPKVVNDPQRGEVFLPPSSHGVKVMSMGFLIPGDQPLAWRGPMLHNVVQQFCHKVNWGELDYLVVDMPPGTGDVQLSLAQLVPVTGAVMVTTPQEVAMQDVRRAFGMFEKVRIPMIGVVENMSWFTCDGCDKRHALFGSEGGKLLARKFNTHLLAQLPIVPAVRAGGDEGAPIVVREPDSAIARSFRELARSVAQQASILAAKNGAPSELIQIGRFN
jgi:ATP-binding protein involved in chromosome partitioning